MNEIPVCGTCNNFDPNRTEGRPLAEDGSKGYCRAHMGLMLGIRSKDLPCPQNFQQYYIPITSVVFSDTLHLSTT